MQNFSFETAPHILSALGGVSQLGQICKDRNLKRVMLVTDAGLRQAGLIDPVLHDLAAQGIAVELFADVQADPPEAQVLAVAAQAKAAQVEGVIGLGGGSSMDTAKLVAVLAHPQCSQALTDMYGVGLVRGTRLPLIQIPTTAGTGSELTPIAILTTPSHEKKGVVASQLYPDLALLDAELTYTVPAHITAATGIDAMVHAIEAYTTKLKKNPISDALAVRALGLLYGNIRRVLANGRDGEARAAMLLGASLAGMAFANAPCAAVHALAYPLGGHFHIPHGHSNALVLLPVLHYNAPAAAQLYAELATCVGVAHTASATDACDAFIRNLEQLVAEMPFAQRLSELKITEADLPMLATDAMKVERLLVNNPREMTYEAALGIYRSVY